MTLDDLRLLADEYETVAVPSELLRYLLAAFDEFQDYVTYVTDSVQPSIDTVNDTSETD